MRGKDVLREVWLTYLFLSFFIYKGNEYVTNLPI